MTYDPNSEREQYPPEELAQEPQPIDQAPAPQEEDSAWQEPAGSFADTETVDCLLYTSPSPRD